MSQDQVRIFDTTLRDGEQAPGFSLRPSEKLELARQLDALGVDIIEAGFPIASPADAEAVRTIADEIRRPSSPAWRAATGPTSNARRGPSNRQSRGASTPSSRRPICTCRPSCG